MLAGLGLVEHVALGQQPCTPRFLPGNDSFIIYLDWGIPVVGEYPEWLAVAWDDPVGHTDDQIGILALDRGIPDPFVGHGVSLKRGCLVGQGGGRTLSATRASLGMRSPAMAMVPYPATLWTRTVRSCWVWPGVFQTSMLVDSLR